jgi:serine/threonine protein kinase/Flp pilus assembly protein TadD
MARIVFAPGCGEAAGDAEKAPQKTTTPTEFGNESKTTLKVTPEPQFNLVGQRIGRYKLLEQIGEGGFGEVYMAEQIEPVQRKVALKIIKAGMDSRQVIARFEAERQALALMDHPNIARVLDAGATESGRPYFVMELVRGISITTYCDQKKLSTGERLQLFIEVCHAVQHAHQKAVIHRDLKPSNVLVTLHDGKPVPKVIDFGIAKALGQKLTDKTLFTGFVQMMGTPAYMSPEQAEMSGLDIDTRSDIYSLGVLLYELLTGQTPFDAKEFAAAGLDGMRRIIREKDPLKPSTRLSSLTAAEQTTVARCRQVDPPRLIHLVRGDLDWVVMKCLEKDRSRRYDTANGVAREIERFLKDEPVVARPPSNLYRFQKLVLRNRLAFAAASAVAVALLIGLVVSTSLFFRARAEAEKNRKIVRYLKDMLGGITPSSAKGQDTSLLHKVLDKAAESVERELAGSPEVLADLQTEIGRVYWAIGEYPSSETKLVSAVTTRRRITPNSLELADSLDILAQPLWYQRRLTEAEQVELEALELRARLAGRNSQEAATALNNLGVILEQEGKLDEAQKRLEEALTIQQNLKTKDQGRIAETLTALSSVLWKKRQFKRADELDRQAIAIYRTIRDQLDPDLALSLNNLATVLLDEGDLEGTIAAAREAVQIDTKIFKRDHPDTAVALHNLAKALWLHGDLKEAEIKYQELLRTWTKLHGPEDQQVAETLDNLGTVLQGLGKYPEAVAAHRQARELETKHGYPGLPVTMNNLAIALVLQGNLAEAEPLLARANRLLKQAGDKQENLAMGLRSHAVVLRNLGQLDKALIPIRECLELCETNSSLQDYWLRFDAMSVLGGILLLQKEYDKAEPLLVSGHEGLHYRAGTIPAPFRPRLRQTLERLVQLCDQWGKPEKASHWKEILAEFDESQKSRADAPK